MAKCETFEKWKADLIDSIKAFNPDNLTDFVFGTALMRVLVNVMELINTKGKAYALSDNRFSNFDDVAHEAGLSRYQIWYTYIAKQWVAVRNCIRGNPQRPDTTKGSEDLFSRISDLIVYALLLAGMLYDNGLLDRDGIHELPFRLDVQEGETISSETGPFFLYEPNNIEDK